MIVTPWGTSDSLRGRRLRPGPGNRAEDVARNQRERVFGAMVAAVSEQGYTATRVSDLVELSGVSSRTFYDLFTDKRSCFEETIEAAIGLGVRVLAEADRANRELPWVERATAALRSFAEMIASQPAAARVCLIEAYAAGPETLRPLEVATAGFEGVGQQILAEAPEEVRMPPEMLTVYVGALQELARNRLRRGTTAELPGLMDAVAEVMLAYRPPPEPLRLATRSPAARPEDLGAHSHAERALRAFAMVVAEKGYAQTTIDEVIARGSMSATTFYANFSGKEDALEAAIDSAGAQVVAAVVPAFERSPDWAGGVRAGFGALFGFLASRPAFAHLLSVGVYGAGVAAIERRDRVLAPLGALVEAGDPMRRFQPSRLALEVLAGGIYGLAYRNVRRGGPESLPALAPLCTYLTLVPFIGAEDACRAANGDGQARGVGADPRQRKLLTRVFRILNERKASAAEIADEVGVSAEQAREHIRTLEESGLIVIMEERRDADGKAAELFFGSNMDWIEDDLWDQMDLPERRAISGQIVRLVIAKIEHAISADTFDARPDRHLSQLPLMIDEQGWQELMALHYRTFHESVAIQAESTERLERSGKAGIVGSSVQMMFEEPSSGLDDFGQHFQERIKELARRDLAGRGKPDRGDEDPG